MISTIIGVVGAVLVLGAFIAGQMHKLKDTDRLYDGLNVIGSGMLLYYAIAIDSWPFLIVNAVWFAVSARDLISPQKRKKKKV